MHRRGLGEFLVGPVAHSDNEVALVPDLAEVPGPQPGKRQAVGSPPAVARPVAEVATRGRSKALPRPRRIGRVLD